MNSFQQIACVILLAAIARDVAPRRGAIGWRIRASRSLVWAAAIVAILNPLWVTGFANLLGIGRGADIVLYFVTLAFVAVTFFFYAQQLRIRRDLSKLAGHIAAGEAERGGAAHLR
jgi:small membrane protein